MVRTMQAILLITALVSLGPGCMHRYVVEGDEASRAAEELVERERITVEARDKKTGEPVSLELRKTDRVLVRMDYFQTGDPSEKHRVGEIDERPEFIDSIELKVSNFGPAIWGPGVGLFGLGWIVSISLAVELEEPIGAVPLYGPIAMMNETQCSGDPEDNDLCGLGDAMNKFMAVSALLYELVGLGLTIAGGVVHQRAARRVKPLEYGGRTVEWDFLAVPLRDGTLVGTVVGRF